MNKAQLVEAVLHLPRAERAEIAATVLRSLDEDLPGHEVSGEEWEKAWADELTKRLDRLDRGDAASVPADRAFADMRERLAKRKNGR